MNRKCFKSQSLKESGSSIKGALKPQVTPGLLDFRHRLKNHHSFLKLTAPEIGAKSLNFNKLAEAWVHKLHGPNLEVTGIQAKQIEGFLNGNHKGWKAHP